MIYNVFDDYAMPYLIREIPDPINMRSSGSMTARISLTWLIPPQAWQIAPLLFILRPMDYALSSSKLVPILAT